MADAPKPAKGKRTSTASTAKLAKLDKTIAKKQAVLDALFVKRAKMATELNELAQAILSATNLPPQTNVSLPTSTQS